MDRFHGFAVGSIPRRVTAQHRRSRARHRRWPRRLLRHGCPALRNRRHRRSEDPRPLRLVAKPGHRMTGLNVHDGGNPFTTKGACHARAKWLPGRCAVLDRPHPGRPRRDHGVLRRPVRLGLPGAYAERSADALRLRRPRGVDRRWSRWPARRRRRALGLDHLRVRRFRGCQHQAGHRGRRPSAVACYRHPPVRPSGAVRRRNWCRIRVVAAGGEPRARSSSTRPVRGTSANCAPPIRPRRRGSTQMCSAGSQNHLRWAAVHPHRCGVCPATATSLPNEIPRSASARPPIRLQAASPMQLPS